LSCGERFSDFYHKRAIFRRERGKRVLLRRIYQLQRNREKIELLLGPCSRAFLDTMFLFDPFEFACLMNGRYFTKAKISNFDLTIVKEDISNFDVSVHNINLMHVF